jgi:hypothetical protein
MFQLASLHAARRTDTLTKFELCRDFAVAFDLGVLGAGD